MLTKESTTRTELWHCNAEGVPVHKMQINYKNEPRVVVYPFSYSEGRGVTKRKISEIELRGWSSIADVPSILKRGSRISLTHKRVAPIMRRLYSRFPRLSKVVITKTGKTKVGSPTATFSWSDFQKLSLMVGREIDLFDTRRKIAVINGLSEVSSGFAPAYANLGKGGLSNLLDPYGNNIALSEGDTDVVLNLINYVPVGSVTVTANFIQTKTKVNIAYLESVIDSFETLLASKSDNEKEWQKFFEEHGWILANVFPYQVILHRKEAYVGGKTIEDSEGRVVDFLYRNGFRDNYALLEIKTHLKSLLKNTPYRAPEAFAQHEDCSGAVSQCLDQKNTFLTDMGQKSRSLDPKVVLVIGQKSKLSSAQAAAFELMRSNQKNVDIVTFDELLEKIRGLRSILQKGT